ncbi:MAG: hypothetical protein GF370_04750 [Candidatus Nealsonbacteria bacterium]|nr:hypothetical protein [Candidatus Nealsonbacteria bacterium]
MNGVLLGAKFSWPCKRSKDLGISQALKEFAGTEGKIRAEAEIKEGLKNLFSYIYYLTIAKSNRISDPFDLLVVKAHWIGNSLLDNVSKKALGEALEEARTYHKDEVILGWAIKPIIDTGSAHHNAYARNRRCSVVIRGDHLYHLGKKVIKASPEDIRNLEKYGEV